MPSFISITIVSEQSSESIHNHTAKVHKNYKIVHISPIKVHELFQHKKYRYIGHYIHVPVIIIISFLQYLPYNICRSDVASLYIYFSDILSDKQDSASM